MQILSEKLHVLLMVQEKLEIFLVALAHIAMHLAVVALNDAGIVILV
jgi:hypothetical protein